MCDGQTVGWPILLVVGSNKFFLIYVISNVPLYFKLVEMLKRVRDVYKA